MTPLGDDVVTPLYTYLEKRPLMSYTQAEHQHQALIDVLASLVKQLTTLTTNTGLMSNTLDRINENLDTNGDVLCEVTEALQGISAAIHYQGGN